MSMEDDALSALKDEGITQERANAANEEVEQRKNSNVSRKLTSHHPLIFFEHGVDTRRASNQFLEDAPKHKLARLLETTDDNVHRRFVGSEPGTCVDLEKPFEQKSLRTDYVYTILALNDISYSNGLPALGHDEKVFSLQKGEVLHFMGDQFQKWSGQGGGNLIWFYWRNLNIQK